MNFREIDLAVHCGEEVFAVVLPYTDGPGAVKGAERVRKAIQGRSFLQDPAMPSIKINLRMGIALYSSPEWGVNEFIQKARGALYQAQKEGKPMLPSGGWGEPGKLRENHEPSDFSFPTHSAFVIFPGNLPLGKQKGDSEMPQKPTILIVDDEERNIRLLKAMLMAKNYNLLEASRGEEALRIVSETPPDMILLDVMMPRMDGFEVCRRLKQDEKTRKIPVIMVTALSEKQHRVKAMEVGADDFLSKPVDLTELTMRVKSLLRIKSYHDELFHSYQEIAAKNAKLEELQKVKEGLTHMIIHDLRNPAHGHIDLSSIGRDGKLQGPTQSQQPKMSRCLYFCAELDRLIQNLLDINKMEEKRMQLQLENTDLETLINDVSDHFRADADERAISLGFFKEEQIPSIPIDRGTDEKSICESAEQCPPAHA